jgi:hypothetical protein
MTATVLPCPFCNFQPDVEDADFCYPNSRAYTDWTCKCYETGGGGCGAEGPYAKTRESAIAAWNGSIRNKGTEANWTRNQLPLFPGLPVIKRVRKSTP